MDCACVFGFMRACWRACLRVCVYVCVFVPVCLAVPVQLPSVYTVVLNYCDVYSDSLPPVWQS